MKKYHFGSENDAKNHKCEICGEQAVTAQIDKNENLRYSCLDPDHVKRLYSLIEKEKRNNKWLVFYSLLISSLISNPLHKHIKVSQQSVEEQ